MRKSILGIVLALGMIGAVFAAFPVNAAVSYTGSVETTDNLGAPKSTYLYGDPVYVNVELNEDGVPFDGYVTVYLERTTDETRPTHFHAWTDNPDVGWNNGSVSGSFLSTGYAFSGDFATYDVVLTYSGNEVARTHITVKSLGLTMDPAGPMYYPGEVVTITYRTTHTADVFYVQIVNDTGATMVNWTDKTALTGEWSTVWTIAADFPDGTYDLYVRDKATDVAWAWILNFHVQKYQMMVDADRNGYLPGETAKITYLVYDSTTWAEYTGATITASAHWLNDSGNDTWQNETLTASSGTYDFLIPSDIALYSNVVINYWANESTIRSVWATVTLVVGLFTADVDVYEGPYNPGRTVTVYTYAHAAGADLPGADVSILVELNGTALAAYGKTGLVTDIDGRAVHTFVLDAAAEEATYVVNVTVSKAGQTLNMLNTFRVAFGGDLTMSVDKAYYFSGDTVVMTFRLLWNNEDIVGQQISYRVEADYGVMVTGSTTGTTASFDIPGTYYGLLDFDANVLYNDAMLGASIDNVQVNFASIILTPASSIYKQGDKVVFEFQILTSLTDGDLAWEIWDHDGVSVASGTPDFTKDGSFSYNVPKTSPSENYNARLMMTTASGGYEVAYAGVALAQDYQLSIWAGKSSYATGEFKPGQKVTMHYSIAVVAGEPLPMYLLVFGNNFDDIANFAQVTEAEGTFTLVIPKDAPNGDFGIWAELWDPVEDDQLWESGSQVVVNSQLSAWDKSVGGMSASDFVILILIVLLLLLLIIVPFLKSRAGGKPAEAPPPAAPPKT